MIKVWLDSCSYRSVLPCEEYDKMFLLNQFPTIFIGRTSCSLAFVLEPRRALVVIVHVPAEVGVGRGTDLDTVPRGSLTHLDSFSVGCPSPYLHMSGCSTTAPVS